MALSWKSVALTSGALTSLVLIVLSISLILQRIQHPAVVLTGVDPMAIPVITAGASSPTDPILHCVTIPDGIRLHSHSISKAQMDRQWAASPIWASISKAMKPGDDIYAYDIILHPPPGGFRVVPMGLGGGYVVLRGWCLVGSIQSWVE